MLEITQDVRSAEFDLAKSGYLWIKVSVTLEGGENQVAMYLSPDEIERLRAELGYDHSRYVEVPEGWTKQDVLDAIEATPSWAGADFLTGTHIRTGADRRFVRVLGEGDSATYLSAEWTVQGIRDNYNNVTAVG